MLRRAAIAIALLLLGVSCARRQSTNRSPPQGVRQGGVDPNIPEAYPRPMPALTAAPTGMVSEAAAVKFNESLDAFSRASIVRRQAADRGQPMSALQRQNWQGLFDAIDLYLAQGLTSHSSVDMIRARAIIEVELEADAQVYEQVPIELVNAVLARETKLGLRAARVQQAGDQRQDRVPPRDSKGRRSSQGGISLLPAGEYLWPVLPAVVNSLFGRRFHPILRRYAAHQGIDLNAATGQRVSASAAGRVIASGFNGGHGLQVSIDHGGGMVTRYSHLSKAAVKRGDLVKRGDRVGLAGASGDVTGPHLHFEFWSNGSPQDPLDALGLPPEGDSQASSVGAGN